MRSQKNEKPDKGRGKKGKGKGKGKKDREIEMSGRDLGSSSRKKNDDSFKGKLASVKKSFESFLDHPFTQIFMTLITLFALLGDDIKLLVFSKSADDAFTWLTTFSLFFFLIELILASVGKKDYFNSFFYWLDLLSTLSLVTDIPWALDLITGDNSESADASPADAAALARASRGARIGTRAGRMTRIIRLIRLIRIFKLWKSAN